MAFRSMKEYNETKYKNWFVLRNDKDFADVIFLYRNYSDVLIADAHYVKSDEYSGYVQCCGRGCPACSKGIRVQQKLFIPLYNISADEIQFWDRNMTFENQLNNDVFDKYPDPSNYVFRITRSGAYRDINTTYSIQAVGRNTAQPYEDILKKFNATMPEYYDVICKDYSPDKLSQLLINPTSNSSVSSDLPTYTVTPRVSVNASSPSPIPETHDVFPEEPSVDSMIPSDDEPPFNEEADEVDF